MGADTHLKWGKTINALSLLRADLSERKYLHLFKAFLVTLALSREQNIMALLFMCVMHTSILS